MHGPGTEMVRAPNRFEVDMKKRNKKCVRMVGRGVRCTPESHRILMLHGYAHLDSLSTGQLERDGLWVLFELIQFGDFLAQKLIHSLNRDDPAAGPMARYVMEHAADCLANVAARSVDAGKFGASGDELTAIRNAMSFIDQMLDIAKPAEAARALIDAGRQVVAATSPQAVRKLTGTQPVF